ncbi:MAG: hypothetical protein HY260_08150 [Chloroflexi bacterium]|nr:hypothetical protein [Chloroflexota bacterium]
MLEKKAGGEQKYDRLVAHYDPRVAPGHQPNTLRAVSSGGGKNINLYVNDSLVETLQDRPGLAGQIGFVVGDRDLVVTIDDFAIKSPP